MRPKIPVLLGSALLSFLLGSCTGKVGVQPEVAVGLSQQEASAKLVKGVLAAWISGPTQSLGDAKRVTAVKLEGPGFLVTDIDGKVHSFLFAGLPLKPAGDGFLDWLATPDAALCWTPSAFGANAKEQDFFNALGYFQRSGGGQCGDDSDFDKNLEIYRALKDKALPEEARKYQVQALGAVDEKRFGHAAECFQKALDLAPWWSQGWYNLALTRAQLKNYPGAVEAMNYFLKLAPEAPEARDAKDKIYLWEDK